jgi:hypothetical protein
MKTKLMLTNLHYGKALAEFIPEHFSRKEGLKVVAEQTEEFAGYQIKEKDDESINIEYSDLSNLMLALGDLISGDAPKVGEKVDAPYIEFRGLMVDCSRNGVLKVEFIKKTMARLALMGMNYFCLYTEDTYEIDGEPLIGYGRGVYTKAEIRELVEFSEKLGITMFPCIQTLGHLENVLKYHKYVDLRDNERVIDITNKASYELIEKFIDNAIEPYNTNLIHLGTDEPWGLGRGRAFNPEKPLKPGKLYAEHLKKVAKLCDKKKLEGIIWGDYLLGHSGESALSEDECKIIPRNLVMNYWNYGITDPAKYAKNIKVYRDMGFEPMLSPGIHNWNRFFGDLEKTRETTSAFMKAAYKTGCKKFMMTMWGDDGQECLFDTNLAGLFHYFAWCRKKNPAEDYWFKKLEKFCGTLRNYHLEYNKLENAIVGETEDEMQHIPAKVFFYDDPLLGFANRIFTDNSVYDYYASLYDELRSLALESETERELLILAAYYSRIISLKVKLNRNAINAYKSGSPHILRSVLDEVPNLIDHVVDFQKKYRTLWLEERKPFGLEVIELRLGGLRTRLESFQSTISDYIEGITKEIPEFELENPEGFELRHLGRHSDVVTRGFYSTW